MFSDRDLSQRTSISQRCQSRSLAPMVIGEKNPRTSNTFPKVEAMERFDTLVGISNNSICNHIEGLKNRMTGFQVRFGVFDSHVTD